MQMPLLCFLRFGTLTDRNSTLISNFDSAWSTWEWSEGRAVTRRDSVLIMQVRSTPCHSKPPPLPDQSCPGCLQVSK